MPQIFNCFRRRFRRQSHPAQQAKRSRRRVPQLECLEARQLLAANLAITELMAANGSTLFDADGDTPDWIEIHNGGSESVDLSGWRLTDNPDDLDKWEFPSQTIDPDQYQIVFASGKDRPDDANPRQRDFNATVDGTFVVDLPQDTYSVDMTLGDALHGQGNVAVSIQDRLRANVTTRPGEFATASVFILVNQTTAGQMVFHFEELGGESPGATINAIRITSRLGGEAVAFDFGTPDSPVAAGYTGVTAADTYDAARGYGWLPETVVIGRDRGNQPHTNFKLGAGGDHVALVSPDGIVVSEFGPHGADFPPQALDVSYGATPDGPRYFADPTPGEPNGSGQTGFVGDTHFSVDRGLFDAPFQVEVTTDTPGATIRYTTDGTLPTATSGIEYVGPITVSGTTTLRAAAFKPELIASNVDTQTYLFPAQVLQQDGAGLESAPWGHSGPDWEMDPTIVHHPNPDSRTGVDDLLSIPSVSLVMNFDDMFGPDGIYIRGESVEKATSVELINSDGSQGFQTDGSVQIVGGTSPNRWKTDKLSMRLKFNKQYGSGALQFPVFGEDATDSFKTLVLDGYLNNVWDYGNNSDQRLRAQYLRDAFTGDLQTATGGYAPHKLYTNLYINGIYWGMYRVHERPDDNFAAAYLGGDNKDYDSLKHNPTDPRNVLQGSNENYMALIAAANQDLSDPAKYQTVEDMLDVDGFIDYMLVNFYVGNTDWAHQNWYASYNRVDPAGRWRFHSWDAEHVMENVSHNVVTRSDPYGPTGIHYRPTTITEGGQPRTVNYGLISNPEYRLRFADHIHKDFFNDGPMTPAGATALYQLRLDQIDRAITAESARWGDNRMDTPSERDHRRPYTRGVEWIQQRDWLLNEYFPQRTGIVLNQLKQQGLYPNVTAPELNQHGGRITGDFDLQLAAPAGTIYYTTDGSDPRLEGGAIAASAIEYAGPFRLAGDATVKARVYQDGQWSALDEAEFIVRPEILVNEVLTRGGDAAPDQVELYNAGDQPVDLSGWYLSDAIDQPPQLTIPGGTTIPAGGYLALSLAGSDLRLSGTRGDDVWLIEPDPHGQPAGVVDHVSFGAADVGVTLGRWPDADRSAALVPMSAVTLGAANSGPATGPVIVSEVDYRPVFLPLVEENFANGSADRFTPVYGTWTVHDGGYEVTPGSEGDTISILQTDDALPANFIYSMMVNARTVEDFNKNAVIIFDYHSPTDFKFAGMYVRPHEWRVGTRDASGWHFLVKTPIDTVVADKDIDVQLAVFGSTVALWSDAVMVRYDFETPLNSGQLGLGSSRAAPRFENVQVGSMAWPHDVQFVELTGTAATPTDLAGWTLRGDVEMTFPVGTTLGPGETLVAVDFDPGDTARAAFFRTTFGIDDRVVLAGPYAGELGRGGQRVRLSKPAVPGDANPGFVWVDEAAFHGQSPWPTAADGSGRSLSRAAPATFGQDASSWSALVPSPGTVHYARTGDLNFDGVVDGNDIAGFVHVFAATAAYQDAYGMPATMVADVDGDGDVDVDDIGAFVALVNGGTPAVGVPTAAQARGELAPVVVTPNQSLASVAGRPAATPDAGAAAANAVRRHDARRYFRRRLTGTRDAADPMAQRPVRGDAHGGNLRHADRRDAGPPWNSLADRALETESVWLERSAVGRLRHG